MTEFNTKENYLKLSDICNKIGQTITSNLGNTKFWIQAEIANFKITGGNCYLNLIEKTGNNANPISKIEGMIWNSKFFILNKKIKEITGSDLQSNLKILFLASVDFSNIYGLKLTIKDIEPVYTLGTLLLQREGIVKRLKEEGHYYLNKKKTFPIVPQRIAVISAMDSKGYEDFINKIEKNVYKYKFNISLFSSLLQGDKAAGDIKRNLLEIFKKIDLFDIVIIIRGGGDAVNLNCFNDYTLSKGVARFPIPVITGIGHTSNISIVDEVAYLDKITPTDVADYIIEQTRKYDESMHSKFEILISKYTEMKTNEVHNIGLKIQNLFHSIDNIKRSRLNFLTNTYSHIVNYSNLLIKEKAKEKNNYKQTLNRLVVNSIRNNLMIIGNLAEKIKNISRYKISKEKEYLRIKLKDIFTNYRNCIRTQTILNKGRSDKIGYLDPKNILSKGYSITLINGKAITNSDSLKTNDKITTLLFEGEIESILTNKIK